MFRRLSSLWLLSLMLLALIAAAMGLMWVLTSWVLSRTFDEVGRAVVLDDLGEYAVLYGRDGVSGVRSLFTFGEHESDQVVRIVGRSGEVLLDIPLAGQPGIPWPDPDAPHEASDDGTLWYRQPMRGGTTFTIGRRRLADGAELWFGRTNSADLEAIDRVHRLIALTMGLTALLSVGPVFWFSSRVLQPVRRLIHDARRLASEDASLQRLQTPGGISELREFAEAFNQSLDRIQSLTDELGAANDQLAHELRTPLARIRGNVEQILASADPAASREAAERAIAEVERGSRLVQMILAIRAGDARTLRLQFEPVAVGALVLELGELYSAAAEDKGLALTVEISGPDAPLAADRQRLQQALCNLLDNAIAFTPRGGAIHVQVASEDHRRWVRVLDTGPGLSEGDAGCIWRRFVRGSAASAGTPGIGLGLALVQAIVRSHRGEVGARNRPGGGAEFWIALPSS